MPLAQPGLDRLARPCAFRPARS